MTGRGNGLLLVVGDVDEVDLVEKLEEKVGDAELVELRALPGDALLAADVVVTQSPYQPGGGRIEWPGQQQAVMGYYPLAPSPLRPQYHHHHPSPVAGQAGGYGYAGGGHALAVAPSHPGNYSPMIERHDYRAVDRARVGRRREHDSAGPTCCSIL